jgi:hypothetical protein
VKLTKEQMQFVTYIEQYFWRKGKIPSIQEIEQDGITLHEVEWFQNTYANELWWKALLARGAVTEEMVEEYQDTYEITLNDDANVEGCRAPRFGNHVLTPQQQMVANNMIDVLDRRSRIKKLTEAGVSTSEFNSWLKLPAYQKYCLDRTENLLYENQHIAHLSLIDRVTQGDMGAIKYFNSMTGRFREKSAAGVEINVQNNYGTDTLSAIVEIIQLHVKDPEVLQAIATDILALNQNQPKAIEGSVVRGYGIV